MAKIKVPVSEEVIGLSSLEQLETLRNKIKESTDSAEQEALIYELADLEALYFQG